MSALVGVVGNVEFEEECGFFEHHVSMESAREFVKCQVKLVRKGQGRFSFDVVGKRDVP